HTSTYNKGYQTDRFNYDNFPVLDNKILIKTEKAHLEELRAIEEKVAQADLVQIPFKRKEHIFSLINSHRKFLNSTRFFFDFNRISMYHTEFTVDRKSTRLNSSHVSISYAVFCLKK